MKPIKQINKNYTNENYISIIMEKEGLKLLSSYKGVLKPLIYLCKCGKTNKTSWHDFRRGTRCGYCQEKRNQKYTQKEVEKFFTDHNCKLLEEYQSVNQKLNYQCSCGCISRTSFKRFKKGNKKCPVCTQVRGETAPNWIKDREELKNRKKFRDKCHYLLINTLQSLNSKKTNNTEILLGYTSKELRCHIESHPNWKNLKNKNWHLDHIFPIKAFIDFKIFDIKIINNLKNLQPLLAKENLQKADKYNQKEFKIWLETNFSDHALKV